VFLCAKANDEVLQAAAVKWCKQATDHAQTYAGKPWQYVLIPHDAIAENMTLEGMARQFAENEV